MSADTQAELHAAVAAAERRLGWPTEFPMNQPCSWRPSRRELARLGLVLPWLPHLVQQRELTKSAEGEPRFVAPPGTPDDAQREHIAGFAAALAAGKSVNEVLLDPATNEVRPFPAFRELIAQHAPMARAQLTPKDEPGTPLSAVVRVVDRGDKPYVGVRVYAYQTSARGWYAAEAPHVSGDSGDTRFARLFSYGVTDARGELELMTVHPTGYPHSDLPSHIHLVLEGRDKELRVTEIRFDDCPRMTPAVRADSERQGFVVVPVETTDAGGKRCVAEFRLPAG